MPYDSIDELPKQVTNNVPKHGQEIYKEAFNNAYDRFKNPDNRRGDEGREEAAHKVAWSAVKQEYKKGDDGNYHRKDD
ncbi:MAG: ChaB family protein [Fimbriimonadaceae bacterium]